MTPSATAPLCRLDVQPERFPKRRVLSECGSRTRDVLRSSAIGAGIGALLLCVASAGCGSSAPSSSAVGLGTRSGDQAYLSGVDSALSFDPTSTWNTQVEANGSQGVAGYDQAESFVALVQGEPSKVQAIGLWIYGLSRDGNSFAYIGSVVTHFANSSATDWVRQRLDAAVAGATVVSSQASRTFGAVTVTVQTSTVAFAVDLSVGTLPGTLASPSASA